MGRGGGEDVVKYETKISRGWHLCLFDKIFTIVCKVEIYFKENTEKIDLFFWTYPSYRNGSWPKLHVFNLKRQIGDQR